MIRNLALGSFMVMVAPGAMASTILVDDFDAVGGIASNLNGNPAMVDVSDANILGGNRTMWASTDLDPGQNFGTTFEVTAGEGVIRFGNGSSALGQAALIYDGGGSGVLFDFGFAFAPTSLIEVNTTGLNVDLLSGFTAAERSFSFSGSSFDLLPSNATFQAFAWDMDGDLVEYSEVIGGPDFSANLGLTEYSLRLGTGNGFFDWSQVGALAFSIESNTPNFDGSLGSISVVPLPASALLLLGGLVGMAAFGRRRGLKARLAY